ncbi:MULTISPECIES: hypothetical protein [unclassified Rathayibacter]|uniref:hypothetical protein n=1 Tax=unclassified Rathayibacter TaxID=2609250 RepID=UPI000CE881DB|nr:MULTISPECIES: hypothetical protein [unclassified Rathayibacter]PPI40784.1 hypothetical protein C5D50_04425 [Rathayibacter sp. RFBD1]PPI60786.1 hypothetical protein C5D38_04160 [Rathayibacter sp. TRS19]QHF21676.1 hypothetical protein GTU71_13095 [Rathayibacter sp. VKM Ac-2762]
MTLTHHDIPSTTGRGAAPVPLPLERSGVLRAWRPEQYGGGPATVADIAARLLALGAEDTDLGWVGAVAAVTNLAVAELPDEALREIWAPGRAPLVCGTLAPQGTGERIGGGFRVRAVSSPASGLPWADWVMATVLDAGAGEPVRVLVPVDEVRTEATWDAFGLRGTGGDSAFLDDVTVPLRRTRILRPDPAAAPLTYFATLFFAAPLIGTVTAAAERVAAEAADGSARWDRGDVRASVSSAMLRVARANALYSAAVAGLGTRAAVDAQSALDRATAADLAVQAVAEAEGALPLLVNGSGAAALRTGHPLARALQDVGAGARHTALSPTKSALAHLDAVFGSARR